MIEVSQIITFAELEKSKLFNGDFQKWREWEEAQLQIPLTAGWSYREWPAVKGRRKEGYEIKWRF